MAVHPPYSNVPIASPDSDYGSDIDIDDATADELFSQTESQSPLKNKEKERQTVLPSIKQSSVERPLIADLEEDVFTHNFSVRLARSLQRIDGAEEIRARVEQIVQGRRREAAVEVEYDERNRREFSPSNPEAPARQATARATPDPTSTKLKDTRTPLQRFKARSPLSVTNLVSPSWCEQQYEYNLSHYGRIPKTKAMSAGSSVHKELEEQVQIEVPVEVVTREDRFGLKLWNTIQGMRALRETGLTRELEVWGVLEGELVNGIIDEVTVECPDVEMEGRVLKQVERGGGGGKGKGGKKEAQLAPDQRTLTDFLTASTQGGSILEHQAHSHPVSIGMSPDLLLRDRPTTTYYLKDIKTTARTSPPAAGAYTRGAHIQLMLYHRTLSSLSAGSVPGQQVFERYRLDPDVNFSDKFIAELANLDMRAFVSVPDDAELPEGSQEWQRDPLGELLERNSLARLWGLLVEECQRTFPATTTSGGGGGGANHASISPLLTVEYRTSKPTEGDGDALIGSRSFPLDPTHLDAYIKSEISWWRGERKTVGVSLEDAWKCGRCEFAEVCEWRRERVEEGLERVRLRGLRVGMGGRSGV